VKIGTNVWIGYDAVIETSGPELQQEIARHTEETTNVRSLVAANLPAENRLYAMRMKGKSH